MSETFSSLRQITHRIEMLNEDKYEYEKYIIANCGFENGDQVTCFGNKNIVGAIYGLTFDEDLNIVSKLKKVSKTGKTGIHFHDMETLESNDYMVNINDMVKV